MTLRDDEVESLAIDLLSTPTKRDRQTKIGASGIGDPCDYCLAMKLLAYSGNGKQKYWLGAKIGTAIHALIEKEALKHIEKPESYHFYSLLDARVEESVLVGHLPHYGDIYSTPDLYLAAEEHLIDWKTTKRDKMTQYKLKGIPPQYQYQGQLYARALNDAGFPVKRVTFVFINRDGTSDADIVAFSFDYDKALADEAWDRLESMWEWLRAGGDPDSLTSDKNCYTCNVVSRRY